MLDFSAIADNYGAGLGLPSLPDLDGIINSVTSCVTSVVPYDVDYQYILDNYATISVNSMGSCIENILNTFKDSAIDYAEQIYSRLFDPEATADSFVASPLIQIIGRDISVSLTAYDRYGDILGKGFPESIVDAQIFASGGNISSTTEILDSYGISTGKFVATLTSDVPKVITLTAKVADIFVSEFDGSTLVTKEIQVEFITTSDMDRRRNAIIGEASSEPLGSVGSE